MNLKVLELPSWAKAHGDPFFDEMREQSLRRCLPTGPVWGRPGRYKCSLYGRLPWLELEDGRAFFEPRTDDFDFALRLLDAERLNHRQIAALQHIADQRLATKEQRDLLRYARYAAEARESERVGRRVSQRVAGRSKP